MYSLISFMAINIKGETCLTAGFICYTLPKKFMQSGVKILFNNAFCYLSAHMTITAFSEVSDWTHFELTCAYAQWAHILYITRSKEI